MRILESSIVKIPKGSYVSSIAKEFDLFSHKTVSHFKEILWKEAHKNVLEDFLIKIASNSVITSAVFELEFYYDSNIYAGSVKGTYVLYKKNGKREVFINLREKLNSEGKEI